MSLRARAPVAAGGPSWKNAPDVPAIMPRSTLAADAHAAQQRKAAGQSTAEGATMLASLRVTDPAGAAFRVARQQANHLNQPSPDAAFLRLLTTGVGLTKRQLGAIAYFTFFGNAVELQFRVPPRLRSMYRNIQPVQWAGPEVAWLKLGHPLSGQWLRHSSHLGTGNDDPKPENIVAFGDTTAFYDSPGPNVLALGLQGPTRIHVVQNFTSWIVGDPIAGGDPRQLSDVAAWHSIVSLGNVNWDDPKARPNWQRAGINEARLGWSQTTKPPII